MMLLNTDIRTSVFFSDKVNVNCELCAAKMSETMRCELSVMTLKPLLVEMCFNTQPIVD